MRAPKKHGQSIAPLQVTRGGGCECTGVRGYESTLLHSVLFGLGVTDTSGLREILLAGMTEQPSPTLIERFFAPLTRVRLQQSSPRGEKRIHTFMEHPLVHRLYLCSQE